MTGVGRLPPRPASIPRRAPAETSPRSPPGRAEFDQARQKVMTMVGRPVWIRSAEVVRLPRTTTWGGRNAPPTHELRVTVDTGKREQFAKLRSRLGLDDVRVRVDEKRAPHREPTMTKVIDQKGNVVDKEVGGRAFPGNNRFR